MLQNVKAVCKGMSSYKEMNEVLRFVEIYTLEKYEAQVEKMYKEE